MRLYAIQIPSHNPDVVYLSAGDTPFFPLRAACLDAGIDIKSMKPHDFIVRWAPNPNPDHISNMHYLMVRDMGFDAINDPGFWPKTEALSLGEKVLASKWYNSGTGLAIRQDVRGQRVVILAVHFTLALRIWMACFVHSWMKSEKVPVMHWNNGRWCESGKIRTSRSRAIKYTMDPMDWTATFYNTVRQRHMEKTWERIMKL